MMEVGAGAMRGCDTVDLFDIVYFSWVLKCCVFFGLKLVQISSKTVEKASTQW